MEKCELHDETFGCMSNDIREIKTVQYKQQETLEKQNGVLREISEALIGNRFGAIGLNERMKLVETKVVSKAVVWKVSLTSVATIGTIILAIIKLAM